MAIGAWRFGLGGRNRHVVVLAPGEKLEMRPSARTEIMGDGRGPLGSPKTTWCKSRGTLVLATASMQSSQRW